MSERVALGRIRRARGLKGEVAAEITGTAADRFQPGLPVLLVRGEYEIPAVVESTWLHNNEAVLKFAGINDRSAAEDLRGLEVCVPLEERLPVPEGEYYLSDLVGCRVETIEGRLVGQVAAWHEFGPVPLLEVRHDGREVLVPFTDAIYREIDLGQKRIVVELPEGLEDLNRA